MNEPSSATIVRNAQAPRFALSGISVTGLASPTRGAQETSVWRLSIEAGAPGVTHSVTREEVFVCISGCAEVQLDGTTQSLGRGDALIVRPHTPFALSNPHAERFEAVVAFPVGGMAITEQGSFTPPWAE